MDSRELKPLQTHGRYVEVWVPPTERFVRYERSDERWARPLGIGTVGRELEALYDVRDETFQLIGYTRHNPAVLGGYRRLPLMFSRASLQSYAPWTNPSEREVLADVNQIDLRVDVYGMGREQFWVWICPLAQSFDLLELKWVSVVGKDNRREWEWDLRKRLADRDNVCYSGRRY